ncbi:MAG: thiamine phosphate synthase [Rhodobacteraceae bacterium]|nr:thiamine phosphate synthase [Paracoccaceae bacterium]
MINRFARAVAAFARKSRKLSAKGPRRKKHMAPPLWWLTDSDRMDARSVAEAVVCLPPGSAVVIRHRDQKVRKKWVEDVAPVCRRRRLVLLVAEDIDAAIAHNCDGFHAPETMVRKGLPCRLRLWLKSKRRQLSVAAHDERAVRGARIPNVIEADAVMIAPVLPTLSHPGRAALGPIRFARLAQLARGRAVALGGIDARTLRRLNGIRIGGVAGIGFAVARRQND